MNHRAYQDLEQTRAAANRLLVAGALSGTAARAQVEDAYRTHPDEAARLIDPIDVAPTFALDGPAVTRDRAATREQATADSLGAYITTLRLAKGWYAEDLARAAPIDPRDLAEFESNRSCPTRARLNRLADVLGADPERMTALAGALRRHLYGPAAATSAETPAAPVPAEEETMLIVESPATPAAFGAYIAQVRAARGLSAWKASRLAGGLCSQDIYRVEAGSRHLGRPRVARLVAAVGGDVDVALRLYEEGPR